MRPSWSSTCSATAGLSLGEYTALVFAGVMEFEAGLRVVQERGRAMQDAADAVSSGMVSVLGMEREQVEALVRRCTQRRSAGSGQLALPWQYRLSPARRPRANGSSHWRRRPGR